jgi:hypothetical protein
MSTRRKLDAALKRVLDCRTGRTAVTKPAETAEPASLGGGFDDSLRLPQGF